MLVLRFMQRSVPLCMDPKACIVDDVYQELRESFLRQGRGLPKALRVLVFDGKTTKKLLVQFAYLKKEGGKTWTLVDKWIKQVAPDVCLQWVATTCFYYLVEVIRKAFLAAYPTAHMELLEEIVDLDMILPTLSQFGVTKSTVGFPPRESVEPPRSIPNQFVVDIEHFRNVQKLEKTIIFQWITHFTNLPVIQYSVSVATKRYFSLLRNKHRNPAAVTAFLEEQFALPVASKFGPSRSNACKKLDKVTKIKRPDCPSQSEQIETFLDVVIDLQSEKCRLESTVSASEEIGGNIIVK